MVDPLGMAFDEDAQASTLRAGWRFYQRRAAPDEVQQALEEWVTAVEAVLSLSGRPALLQEFENCLTEALGAAKNEALVSRIHALLMVIPS